MASPEPNRDGGRKTGVQRTQETKAIVFTTLPGATQLRAALSDLEAEPLIQKHHSELRMVLSKFPEAVEVELVKDSFRFLFPRASDAVQFALIAQDKLRRWKPAKGHSLIDGFAIHLGEVVIEHDAKTGQILDVHGLEVDTCDRVISLAENGRILLTQSAYDSSRNILRRQKTGGTASLSWTRHGYFTLKGINEPVEICEVRPEHAASIEPPADTDMAHRFIGQTPVEFPDTGESDIGLTRFITKNQLSRPRRFAIALATAFLGAIIIIFSGRWVSHVSYDLSFLFKAVDPPGEVVIVEMDPRSEADLGQPDGPDWDRRIHAKLLDRLHEFGAKAVVFDIVFDKPSADPGRDDVLLTAIKRFGNVALAASRHPRFGVEFHLEEPALPLLHWREHVRWGAVNRSDEKMFIRKATIGNDLMPALAEVAARMYTGPGLKAPKPNAWVNYYGPRGTIKGYRYSQVLSNHVPHSAFDGKLVLVGQVYDIGRSGPFYSDEFNTPYSRVTGTRTPGVEVMATSIVNSIRGDWLQRISPLSELLLMLGFGLGVGSMFPVLRPGAGGLLAILGALVLPAASTVFIWQTHIWFSWVVLAWIQLPVAYLLVIILRTQEMRRRETAWRLRSGKPSSAEAVAGALQGEILEPRHEMAGNDAGRSFPLEEGPIDDSDTMITELEPTLGIPQYRLIRRIGEGSFGEVWLAQDLADCYCAIKVVYERKFESKSPYNREFEGLRLFRNISNHPGLVLVLHIGREDSKRFFYYVMELADDAEPGAKFNPETYEARTLAADLHRANYLDARDTIRLGMELSEAVEFLHRHGLIHRDIKPGNILFREGRAKLADIGLVTAVRNSPGEASFVGTLGYIPPEGPGAPSADVYSLGKVLYVAVTGLSAKDFPVLPDNWDQRPDRAGLKVLNDILLKACEPNVAMRYQTAETLLTALRQAHRATVTTSAK